MWYKKAKLWDLDLFIFFYSNLDGPESSHHKYICDIVDFTQRVSVFDGIPTRVHGGKLADSKFVDIADGL